MVLVSHDPTEMRRLATNVVILGRGYIIAQGGPEILPV
jgi:molybdate transport system ATP-binding protein